MTIQDKEKLDKHSKNAHTGREKPTKLSTEYCKGLYDGIRYSKKLNDRTWEAYYRKYPKTDEEV